MFLARRVFKRYRDGHQEERHSRTSPAKKIWYNNHGNNSYPVNHIGGDNTQPSLEEDEVDYNNNNNSHDRNDNSSSHHDHDDDYDQSESSTGICMEHPPRKRYRVDNTPFPVFDIPDAECTDVSSSDEESVRQRDEQIALEAETGKDVEVFLGLAKRMSLQSLLHLLQGAARAQLDLPEAGLAMMEYNFLLAGHRKPDAAGSHDNGSGTTTTTPKIKKFRFAQVSDDKVRCVVHYVESYKDERHLWWTNDEMMLIRYAQVRMVRHFRKHRPQFLESVETLVKGTERPAVLEQHMRRLTEGTDSYARGLETHAVRCIAERRKSHILAVLQEQADCKGSGDGADVTAVCLAEQSIAYSALLAAYAVRMAKCDQIDALKASMSAWEPAAVSAEPMQE